MLFGTRTRSRSVRNSALILPSETTFGFKLPLTDLKIETTSTCDGVLSAFPPFLLPSWTNLNQAGECSLEWRLNERNAGRAMNRNNKWGGRVVAKNLQLCRSTWCTVENNGFVLNITARALVCFAPVPLSTGHSAMWQPRSCFVSSFPESLIK